MADKNNGKNNGSDLHKGITVQPATVGGNRQRLCALLNLKSPTDAQLFEDAVAMIEKLTPKK